MASSTDLVLQNFIYRISTVSPTSTLCNRKFRYNPRPRTVDPDTSAGMVRSFTVRWTGSTDTNEVQDVAERVSDSEWLVEVAYPIDCARGDDELQRLMLQDRHDIIKVLRDTSYFDGVTVAASSTETNLHRREFIDDVQEEDDQTVYYRQRWSCTIFESE